MDADFWEEHKPKFLKSTHLAEEVPHYPPTDPYPTVPSDHRQSSKSGVQPQA